MDEEGTTKVTGFGRMEVDAWSEEDVETRNTDEAQDQRPTLNCCSSRCTAKFNLLEMEKLKSVFATKKHTQQKQWIMDLRNLSVSAIGATAIQNYSDLKILILNGKACCKKAFLCLLHTSQARGVFSMPV